MPNFEVTRELVQELAETGSAQLGVETASIAPAHTNFISRIDEEVRTYHFTDFCADSHFVNIGRIAEEIFLLAGEPVPDNARLMEWTTNTGTFWHPDTDTTFGGISILTTSLMTVRNKDEVIETAGRGLIKGDEVKKLRYCKGPVVLAQDRFGKNLLAESQSSGGVWHKASRSVNSRVRIFDFW